MTYGKIVAKRYKNQYFIKKKWLIYSEWDIQPKEYYTILLELKTKAAIEALIGKSWTRNLPVKNKKTGKKVLK